jgi:hypothetical protein
MKYKITLQKIEETKDDIIRTGHFAGTRFDSLEKLTKVLFEADIESDGCIEILRHLYDLKDKQIKCSCKENEACSKYNK